jgi:hypothetical protein
MCCFVVLFHKRCSRRDPVVVLRELAVGCRREHYHRQMGKKLKELSKLHSQEVLFRRKQNQIHRQRLFKNKKNDGSVSFNYKTIQRLFVETHKGLPEVFSFVQSADLKIAIGETGLPLFVCSHPNCPLYLQALGPKPLSDVEAKTIEYAIDKDGVPECNNTKCKRVNKPMMWSTAERAERFQIETKESFFFVCTSCKKVLSRPGDDTPRNRHYLYSHLSALFVPSRMYVKGLHIAAKGIMVSQKTPIKLETFVRKLLPLLEGVEGAEVIQLWWIVFISCLNS